MRAHDEVSPVEKLSRDDIEVHARGLGLRRQIISDHKRVRAAASFPLTSQRFHSANERCR